MVEISVGACGDKGRGVYADKQFAPDEVVEAAPVIVLPDPQYELLEQTALKDYYFYWTEQSVALGLGYSPIYNHSTVPNAAFVRDFENQVMRIVALHEIKPGEEITVSYHCEPWFKVID